MKTIIMRKHFLSILPIATLLSIASLLGSCRKLPNPNEVSSDFIVYTNYDSKADFNSYKTFIMAPYVGAVSDNPNDSLLDPALAGPIMDEVKQNLIAKGYTQVGLNEGANIGIVITVLKNVSVTGYYPGSWWGYPGWGGCYWGYCGSYPGYPPYYPVYVVYETGSVVVEMVDLKNITPGVDKLNVIWTNWNGGALGDQSGNLQNALNSIKQGFAQSPYLSTK